MTAKLSENGVQLSDLLAFTGNESADQVAKVLNEVTQDRIDIVMTEWVQCTADYVMRKSEQDADDAAVAALLETDLCGDGECDHENKCKGEQPTMVSELDGDLSFVADAVS